MTIHSSSEQHYCLWLVYHMSLLVISASAALIYGLHTHNFSCVVRSGVYVYHRATGGIFCTLWPVPDTIFHLHGSFRFPGFFVRVLHDTCRIWQIICQLSHTWMTRLKLGRMRCVSLQDIVKRPQPASLCFHPCHTVTKRRDALIQGNTSLETTLGSTSSVAKPT